MPSTISAPPSNRFALASACCSPAQPIATSFLGGLAIDTTADRWDWLAVSFFALFAVVCLKILWPEAEGARGYTAKPSLVMSNIIEGTGFARWEVERELALHMEITHDVNESNHLTPLTRWSRAAIILLIFEILVWIIDLI